MKAKSSFQKQSFFELKSFSKEKIDYLFEEFKILIEKIEILKNQKCEDDKLSFQRHLPLNNALHAIIARDSNAIMIV